MKVKDVLKVSVSRYYRVWVVTEHGITEHFIDTTADEQDVIKHAQLHDYVYIAKSFLPKDILEDNVNYIDAWDDKTLLISIDRKGV